MDIDEAIVSQAGVFGHGGTDDVVLDLLDGIHHFQSGVGNTEPLLQQPFQAVDRDIGEFANRRREHQAAAPVEIARKIGAAAEEAYAKRRGGDDAGKDLVSHDGLPARRGSFRRVPFIGPPQAFRQRHLRTKPRGEQLAQIIGAMILPIRLGGIPHHSVGEAGDRRKSIDDLADGVHPAATEVHRSLHGLHDVEQGICAVVGIGEIAPCGAVADLETCATVTFCMVPRS